MLVNNAQVQEIAATGRESGRYPRVLSEGAEIGEAVNNGNGDRENQHDASLSVRGGKQRRSRGFDNLGVTELKLWLKQHWVSVKQALIEDNYLPMAIRRMDIPKLDGGVRTLGITDSDSTSDSAAVKPHRRASIFHI